MSSSLREHVQALHTELADTRSVDPESRDALVTLLRDITRILEGSDAVPDDASLADRLETQAVRFEADHPALGAALRQLVDALAKAGI